VPYALIDTFQVGRRYMANKHFKFYIQVHDKKHDLLKQINREQCSIM